MCGKGWIFLRIFCCELRWCKSPVIVLRLAAQLGPHMCMFGFALLLFINSYFLVRLWNKEVNSLDTCRGSELWLILLAVGP